MTKERQQCDTRSTNRMTESPRVHSEAACLRNPPQESRKLTYERPLMSDISKRPLPTPRSLSKHAASGTTPSQAWDYQQVYPASYPEQSTQVSSLYQIHSLSTGSEERGVLGVVPVTIHPSSQVPENIAL